MSTNKDVINQLSLVLNVAEDIAKACMVAGIHPDLTRVLVQMHTSQKELEREINEGRRIQVMQAHLIERLAGNAAATAEITTLLAQRTGIMPEELVNPEAINPNKE